MTPATRRFDRSSRVYVGAHWLATLALLALIALLVPGTAGLWLGVAVIVVIYVVELRAERPAVRDPERHDTRDVVGIAAPAAIATLIAVYTVPSEWVPFTGYAIGLPLAYASRLILDRWQSDAGGGVGPRDA